MLLVDSNAKETQKCIRSVHTLWVDFQPYYLPTKLNPVWCHRLEEEFVMPSNTLSSTLVPSKAHHQQHHPHFQLCSKNLKSKGRIRFLSPARNMLQSQPRNRNKLSIKKKRNRQQTSTSWSKHDLTYKINYPILQLNKSLACFIYWIKNMEVQTFKYLLLGDFHTFLLCLHCAEVRI